MRYKHVPLSHAAFPNATLRRISPAQMTSTSSAGIRQKVKQPARTTKPMMCRCVLPLGHVHGTTSLLNRRLVPNQPRTPSRTWLVTRTVLPKVPVGSHFSTPVVPPKAACGRRCFRDGIWGLTVAHGVVGYCIGRTCAFGSAHSAPYRYPSSGLRIGRENMHLTAPTAAHQPFRAHTSLQSCTIPTQGRTPAPRSPLAW